MTPNSNLAIDQVNWRNFKKGAQFAKLHNVSTVLLTSKGEPTLFPDLIASYLGRLENYEFPFIELQTNGIAFQIEDYDQYLKSWYRKGITTIALSIGHYDDDKNNKLFNWRTKERSNLSQTIKELHEIGFSVRVSCLLLDGYIDSPEEISNLVNWAKKNEVEQLTVRELGSPEHGADEETEEWVRHHKLYGSKVLDIQDHIKTSGTELMKLVHGATVYDFEGQNLCLTNCLTIDPNDETIRQLIFFPDGHLRYDWQYKGAILI